MMPQLWRSEPLNFNGCPEESRMARSVSSFVTLFLKPALADRITCDGLFSTELNKKKLATGNYEKPLYYNVALT